MAKKKKKGVLAEFKEFALRGNVVDLAVGVLIGGAFQTIISSLINDLIMPWMGLLTGGINFADQFVVLRNPTGNVFYTLSQAQAEGATVFSYGAFITNVINFIIMALVIFLLVKMMNKLRTLGEKVAGNTPEEASPEEPTTKLCPHCCMEVPVAAQRCGHCTSQL